MVLKLFRAAASGRREEKASAAGPLLAIQSAGKAVWSPRDTVSLTRAGYAMNVIGFRAVRMVAEAAGAVPLCLLQADRKLAEHPLLRLLAQPNPAQDGRSFLETVYGHLQLSGNAYVEGAGPDDRGLPRELHALRPDRVAVVPGPDGWPAAYDYVVGSRRHRFSMGGDFNPVLHLKAFHPLDDHYGMSPLEAAAQSIDVHNAASRWVKALLDNAARPSGAVVFTGADGSGRMSEEQYQRLVSELEENHQGARNAGRPMLLEGGLDWKPMGYSPEEMEFLSTRSAAAREIALAFGVPPMLLGLPGDNTYSNYQEANRAFYRQTILPLVRKVSSALSGWLHGNTGEIVTIVPDLEQVPALSDEREALWRRVSGADFLSDDEKRALLGLAPTRQAERTGDE